MTRLAGLALLFLLAAAPAAATCPLCADSEKQAGKTATKIWTAVGFFLVVPPILGVVVIGAMRRELKAGGPREGVPTGHVRLDTRD